MPEMSSVETITHRPSECAGRSPQILTVGPRGGVAGAVVVLTGVHEGRALAPAATTLRVEPCGIEPRVLAMARGAALRIESRGEGAHNAHATDPGGVTRFDLGLPAAGATATLSVDRPGILRVVDDAGDPLATGWIHVIDHPYFAVTDGSGTFRLPEVPPGQYTLEVWHEGVLLHDEGRDGELAARPETSAPILLSRMVTVVAGQDTAVDFTMDLRSAEAAGD